MPQTRAEIRVRGFHTDLYGHVNNSRYLEFLEEGRWKLFEASPQLTELISDSLFFYVVRIDISFRRGLRINELAQVETRLVRLGDRSGLLKQTIREAESQEICAEADVTFVISDGTRALPIQGELREILETIPLERQGLLQED